DIARYQGHAGQPTFQPYQYGFPNLESRQPYEGRLDAQGKPGVRLSRRWSCMSPDDKQCRPTTGSFWPTSDKKTRSRLGGNAWFLDMLTRATRIACARKSNRDKFPKTKVAQSSLGYFGGAEFVAPARYNRNAATKVPLRLLRLDVPAPSTNVHSGAKLTRADLEHPSQARETAQATRCLRICRARWHVPRYEVLDLIHCVEGLVFRSFGRQTRRVWSSDHVGASRQRERRHLILRPANVKSCAGDALVVERTRKRGLVDQVAARQIYEIGRWHHLRKGFGVHQILGLLVGDGQAHDEIGSSQQFCELD